MYLSTVSFIGFHYENVCNNVLYVHLFAGWSRYSYQDTNHMRLCDKMII